MRTVHIRSAILSLIGPERNLVSRIRETLYTCRATKHTLDRIEHSIEHNSLESKVQRQRAGDAGLSKDLFALEHAQDMLYVLHSDLMHIIGEKDMLTRRMLRIRDENEFVEREYTRVKNRIDHLITLLPTRLTRCKYYAGLEHTLDTLIKREVDSDHIPDEYARVAFASPCVEQRSGWTKLFGIDRFLGHTCGAEYVRIISVLGVNLNLNSDENQRLAALIDRVLLNQVCADHFVKDSRNNTLQEIENVCDLEAFVYRKLVSENHPEPTSVAVQTGEFIYNGF